MTGTPNNPNNTGQQTRIQGLQPRIRANVIKLLNGGLLIGIGHFINLSQLPEALCKVPFLSKVPFLCLHNYPAPQWIGTKIEEVYNKALHPPFERATTLAQTDKPWQDNNAILKNTDQDLSAINKGNKHSSGKYEVRLRRANKEKKPICLRIYGERNFEKSEFKNIISIRDFPTGSKPYDSLKPEERDKQCAEKYSQDTEPEK